MTAAPALPAIQAQDLRLAYRSEPETTVLQGIDLSIPAGQVVGLLGKSGAGKTSLLRLLGGWLPSTAGGQIKIFGQPLTPQSRPANLHSLLVENTAIDPGQTLDELIPAPGPETRDLLQRLGLRSLGQTPIAHLPQTLQYRAALASALVRTGAPAGIYLIDELPGLDPETASVLQAWLPDWAHGLDQTVLLASRIPAVILSLCDRVLVLRQGCLAQDRWIPDLEKRPASLLVRIRLKGRLDAGRASWFPGLRLFSDRNDTLIEGEISDQSSLHGLLVRIRDLGLPLERVEHITPNAEDLLRAWM